MKKLFIAAFCLTGLFASAQFTLRTLEGTVINNGDVLTFHGLEEPDNYLGFKIHNETAGLIKIKVECISITNFDPAAEGTNALCLDPYCNYNIVPGSTYNNSVPLSIAANSDNGNFDYFENFNPGLNPEQPLEYVLKMFQTDASGGDSGISVTFTFRYTPQLSSRSFSSLSAAGISVNSTMIKDRIDITATNDFRMELFDTTGKSLLGQNLNSGRSAVDCSQLNAGIYIARFRTVSGQNASLKLIKN